MFIWNNKTDPKRAHGKVSNKNETSFKKENNRNTLIHIHKKHFILLQPPSSIITNFPIINTAFRN